MSKKKDKIGNLAIALALVVIPIVFITPIIIPFTRDFFWMKGPFVIWIFEFFALIFGIASRKTLSGKIAIVVSIVISFILVLYFSVGLPTIEVGSGEHQMIRNANGRSHVKG